MDNRKTMQNSIDYIEENLKTDITVKELADMAGFSLFHYYRLFQGTLGLPVMQYIIQRKLINAIYEISLGNKMIDVALLYGFETHAGFFKAFRREYNCSPSQFLKSHKAKRPYKINLFKEEPIMLTHKKITGFLKNWNLENQKIEDVFYKSSGNHNDNAYYVGDDYVIKFSTNPKKLQKHIEISKALENAGMAAAVPIISKDGREYLQDGELYFMVTKRLKGKQIECEEMYQDNYPQKARYVGEIIGQLHLILEKENDIAVKDVNLFESVKSWALPEAKKIMGLDDNFCEEYLSLFGTVYDKLPKQVIHRDPNPGNIIIDDENKFGFIDFDLSERNVRIFDPCYAATGILVESFSENDNEKLTKWKDIYKNIICGYDHVAKLSKEEKQAVPYVVLAIQFICVAYFSEYEKFYELAEVNKKMLSWLIDNAASLKI